MDLTESSGVYERADHLRPARIGRLERSLVIQASGLAEDLAKLADQSLSEIERAGIEGDADATRRDIADLHQQIAGLRADLAGVA